MVNILGISAYYHDSAACLVQDGKLVAAVQEERFTRKKHDANFPTNAVLNCLQQGNIEAKDLDYICFYDKPFIKFERILQTYMDTAPFGFPSFVKAIPLWIKQKLWIPGLIEKELGVKDIPILFTEHHESHATSAFFPSPYNKAAILTLDGVGEWATSSIALGEGNRVELLKEIHFPHSLGLLYSAFTYYTGFKVNSGEYKVMGLAPYGEPKYKDVILQELMDLKDDGSFKLNMEYFNYLSGLTMTNTKFSKLFGGPPRKPESELTQREMDIARSIQDVTEEIVLRMARHTRDITQCSNLCLAGGVALNCVANGKILKEKIFDKVWVQPAAGDAGGAIGAALFVWYSYLGNSRKVNERDDEQFGSLLGPKYSHDEIRKFLNKNNIAFKHYQNEEELSHSLVDLLANEKVIGLFQGRMEFGPRALGARSIIGDPRSSNMQSIINLKIKYRESFRPFAPAVLEEDVGMYFDIDAKSPYMLFVAPIQDFRRNALSDTDCKKWGIESLQTKRSDIPAVTHVDYSARVQTVNEFDNPFFYQLLKSFKESTGCSVLVNTSFNVRGEPIVCTPEDAYRCFMRTNMDYLVLENYVLDKKEMAHISEDTDWKEEFELD